MGRISRRIIDPEIEEKVFDIFRSYLVQLHTSDDTQAFLTSLLSHTEQVMLAKRLAIAVLLTKGYTYEQIDETLKVSKSTVGTVHKQLLIGAVGYQKAVERVLKDEKHEKLWSKFENLLLSVALTKAHGSLAWKKKSESGKKLAKKIRKLNSL